MFGHTNEPFALERDVKAVIIPAGEELLLREGTPGFITQSLGGSFHDLCRGQPVPNCRRRCRRVGQGAGSATCDSRERIGRRHRGCCLGTTQDLLRPGDSGQYCRSWPDLPLRHYACGNGERSVRVDMTLTAPGCGMGEILVQDAQEKIAVIPTISDVVVELVFDPPWNQSMMSDEARLQTGLM